MFILVLGLALLLEGLPYFISPRGVRRYIAQLLTLKDSGLRSIGFALMLCGLILAYLATR
jgi:uncharacterized protein YjeT (DUF2065 family)